MYYHAIIITIMSSVFRNYFYTYTNSTEYRTVRNDFFFFLISYPDLRKNTVLTAKK